ncbi:MAG: MBL fold metallo-hydrolase [Planctomycetota bacterium]
MTGPTRLTFHGAAGTVTGSRFLLEAGRTRLLVDCGLFQGLKVLRKRNWRKPGFEPQQLDAVVLTHAHIDHSGYLPRLVKEGFREKILATHATRDLCRILLPDCGRIQEEDALYAAKEHYSKHHPPEPLYTEEDAVKSLEYFRAIALERDYDVGDLRFAFRRAGHILGAASAMVETPHGKVLFSGDLGRDDDLLMYAPEPPGDPDWVVVESTYGDREHPDEDPFAEMAEPLRRTFARGGIALVPSFAVARTQAMLLVMKTLMERGEIREVPIFVDSPMATNVTEVYCEHDALHKLSHDRCAEVFGNATYTRTVEDSKALDKRSGPMIVISASGMLSGGRVLHHLKAMAGDPRNTIVLPGYQAVGTRGRSLLDGAKSIRVHGKPVRVEAEVVEMPYFSAHADRSQVLAWLRKCEKPPKGVYLVHGEPEAAESLRQAIRDELGFEVDVADQGETVELD